MEVAVAGQLTLDDALAVATLKPDYVGVRGAVCRPDRNGDIDPAGDFGLAVSQSHSPDAGKNAALTTARGT